MERVRKIYCAFMAAAALLLLVQPVLASPVMPGDVLAATPNDPYYTDVSLWSLGALALMAAGLLCVSFRSR